MEITEKKFSNWCKKNNFFVKKFMTHTSTGHGGKQEADFLIANDKFVAMVECKERMSGRFNINDLTQYRKLKALERKSTIIKQFILINFEKEKSLVKLSLKEFETLRDSNYFKNNKLKKSFTLRDIPNNFITTWEELKF